MNPKMLISAHVDHEVEEPWATRVDELIRQDREMEAEAQLHHKVKHQLAEAPWPAIEDSQIAVWSRLQALAPREALVKPTTFLPWWSYPAVAAVLAFVLGSGFWLGTHSAPASQNLAELKVQVPGQYSLQLSGDGQLLKVSTMEGGAP